MFATKALIVTNKSAILTARVANNSYHYYYTNCLSHPLATAWPPTPPPPPPMGRLVAIQTTTHCRLHTNRTADDHNDSKQSNGDHLNAVQRQLSESLPAFFVSQHCFHLYSPNVVFEDNIRHVKTKGMNNYMKQLVLIKFWAHLKYSHKSLNVLKMTQHPEDMTVRVRWRIVGTPGLGVILMFWKYRFWSQSRSVSKDNSQWTDGFSIFYVGSDGLIHKHVVQKIMPDEELSKSSNSIPVKNLAFIVGLVPQLPHFDLNYQQLVSKLLELTTKYCSFG